MRIKECRKCHSAKPLTEFYIQRGYPSSWCRSCTIAHNREWAAKNREKTREYKRAYAARNAEREAKRSRAKNRRMYAEGYRYKGDRERLRARAAVSNAIRRGQLAKPAACPQCGTTGKRIDAHHEDYAKPLDVTWLCSRCHALEHKTTRKARAA